MIIVGSTALACFGMNRREPKDLDVWLCSNEEAPNNTDSMVMPDEIMNLVWSRGTFATPNTIYTTKCSHLGWDIHWEKTKIDILWLHHRHGCQLIPDLYDALVRHWRKVNGNKDFLSLSRDKREFFNDHVVYIHDHDYLHELVAYPEPPMYSRCLKDGQDVLIDKKKFDLLQFSDKVRMFKEEIIVIAVERWLVNPRWKGKFCFQEAYRLALKKTIVSLTKNWATDFIVTNLQHFNKPDAAMFAHINKELKIIKMCDVIKDLTESYLGFEGTDEDTDEYYIQELMTDGHDDTEGTAEAKWAESVGFEHLQQEGGGEGGTEHCECVFKFNGKTYLVSYNYYSHDGYNWDYAEAKEVKPVQKMVTVYE